jgi:hypothetical protein
VRYPRTNAITAIHFWIVLMTCAVGLRAEESTVEAHASAVFLVNFLKFAHFPSAHVLEPSGKIRILCFGADPVFSSLVRLQSQPNSHIEVKITSQLRDLPNIELIVVGRSEGDRIDSILKQLQASNVYTASSIVGFALKGGMLEFGYSTNRINYQLNIDQIREHRLSVSSRFLNLGEGKKERSP